MRDLIGQKPMFYQSLYDNPSYSRILIGPSLWSIEGQMHDDVTTTKFFLLGSKMAESFEKLDNILHDWEKR